MKRVALSFATILALGACDSGKESADTKPKTEEKTPAKGKAEKSEARPDAKAKDAKAKDAKAKDGDSDMAKADGKEPEKSEEEKKKERLEAIAKAMKELDEQKAAEAKRWTDEGVAAKVDALLAGKYADDAAKLTAILASPHRLPGNADRDGFRHPMETLAFLGAKSDMTIVEVGPGRGWYTEVLAALVAGKGKLVINSGDPKGPEDDYGTVYAKRIAAVLERSDALYGGVQVVIPKDPKGFELGAPGSADMVLVIRGLHGVARRGELAGRLKVMSDVLKPGGTLGIVQHRAADDAKMEDTAKDGYLPQPWLVEQVEKAGFELVEASEINANPKDTKDHPEGVWTLPPTLELGDKDKDKYTAIGESDRMTLKFKKK